MQELFENYISLIDSLWKKTPEYKKLLWKEM